MKVIKYQKGFARVFPVDKESFARQSHMQKPYVNMDGYFAYCPLCENPVKLLGLRTFSDVLFNIVRMDSI